MKKIWLFLPIFLVIAGVVGAVFWFGSPQLTETKPQNSAQDVHPGAPISLTFSRRMELESVLERLSIEPSMNGSTDWEGNTLTFTPNRPWPPGEDVQVNLAEGARAAGWLSLPMREGASFSFKVRQPRLLFLYPSDKSPNLYTYNPSTQETTRLTDILGGIFEYDVTFDGSAVYYSTQNSQGGSDIYRLQFGDNLTGLQADLVLHCGSVECRAPRIAPLEDFLAYERTSPPGVSAAGYPQVEIVKLRHEAGETGSVNIVVDGEPRLAGDQLHQTIQPDWSPTGVLSFYDSSQKAFVLFDPRNQTHTSLTNQTGEPGSWRPDGEAYVAAEIFFNTGGNPQTTPDLRPVASSHLLRYAVETGAIDDLTGAESFEDTAPVFSPDGEWLAFARKFLEIKRWTPGRQLWMMRADGAEPIELTNEPEYNHFDFAWEPAGRRIAYVRFNQAAPTEPPEVWVYDIEKKFANQLIQGGFSPHWMP